MEASRQQLQACRANQGPRPVLEEFIPLKSPNSDNSDKALNISDNKANWMTSAQLWSPNESKPQTTVTNCTQENSVSPKLGLDTNHRNGGGGAFLPFSREKNSCPNQNLRALPELALASVDNKDQMLDDKKCNSGELENKGVSCSPNKVDQPLKGSGNSTDAQTNSNNNNNNNTGNSTNQTHRKARRCWSPDLHRRFVNALQMLGGSQGKNQLHNTTT